MNLYRFEVILTIDENEKTGTNKVAITKEVHVIITAKDDKAAFSMAEVEIEKYYLKLPRIKEVVLLEKKRVGKGSGYVIDEAS
jgi:hypothetical protein